MSTVCPRCGPTTNVFTDTRSNEKVCGGCSQVLEDSRIVSEVTFGESTSGAAIVTGSFVAHDQSHAIGSGGKFGPQGESRALTLEKARQRITKVAQRLHIPEPVAGSAFQYYKLALQRNFVKGRKSQYVVSACLYVACRRAETTHMLMDFAETIYVNVFQIGATYLQLVKCLNIQKIPIVDPSIFIERFTAQLSFGDEGSKRVREDANKLAQRMNRDWLVYGRRPAGIAAACILLAARMNNFRRSKTEIVQIAKIAEETVQRRLDEFKVTSAGTLTVADFRSTQVETEADPPSYTRHRVNEMRDEQKAQKKKELGDTAVEGEPEDEDEEDDGLITEMIRDIDQQAKDEANVFKHAIIKKELKDAEDEDEFEEDSNSQEKEVETVVIEDEKDEEEKRIEAEINETLHDPSFKRTTNKAWQVIRKYRENRDELIKQNKHTVSEVRDDPDHLSDVDDDEVDSFILSEKEVEIKSQVWMTLNREYLIEQENKRLKMEADIKAGTYKAPKKRKRKPKNEDDQDGKAPEEMNNQEASATAAESATKMLQARAFSKKINYAAMGNLFKKKPKVETKTEES